MIHARLQYKLFIWFMVLHDYEKNELILPSTLVFAIAGCGSGFCSFTSTGG
jgi:hypothetical protein